MIANVTLYDCHRHTIRLQFTHASFCNSTGADLIPQKLICAHYMLKTGSVLQEIQIKCLYLSQETWKT